MSETPEAAVFDGPAGPPPAPAAPPEGPGERRRRRRRTAAVAVVAVAAVVGTGAGIGSRLAVRGSVATGAVVLPAPSSTSGISAGSGAAGGASAASTGTVSPAQAAVIAAQVDPAVVDINTVLGYQDAAAAGTGMVLTATGEILTNNHVIDGATSITVTVVSTGRTYQATVVGTDPTADVAVIQLVGASGLRTVQAASAPAALGEGVVAIGNAGGTGGTPAVTTGSVQALNQTITASDETGSSAEQLSDLVQIDATLQPGDSGGPLVNSAGQVVAMDTAASAANQLSSATSVGYAIPISDALAVARQIEAGQASATVAIGLPGILGVSVAADASAGSAMAGAAVTAVASGSPAAAAGLVAGDTITSLNGQAVASAGALSAAMAGHHAGDRVTVGWTTTGGTAHQAVVTLMTGPAD